MTEEIGALIERVTQSGQAKVRFGRGIVGALPWLAGTAVLGLAGIAIHTQYVPLQVGGGVAILVVFCFAGVMLWHLALKRPDALLLEGAEFVRYHQLMQESAKGIEALPDLANPQLDPGPKSSVPQRLAETPDQ